MSITDDRQQTVDFDRTDAERAAQAAGVVTEEPQIIDYFGFDETHTFYLDDTKQQYFIFKELNEGQLAKFQKNTSRDVVMQRNTGNAKMRMDPASERHELIKAAVVGWRLFRKSDGNYKNIPAGQIYELPYSEPELERTVLKVFPSSVIAKLEKAIRDANPSLKPDQTPDEIREAIELLQKDLAEAEGKEIAS